jgi:DUF4097 and DUF4098 domain-containing protein YvlB
MNQRLLLPLALAFALAHPALALAGTPINQTRALAADGRVSISNVSGSITVRTWDKPQVQVTGTLGKGVEKLRIAGDARSLTIEVKYPDHDGGWFGSKIHAEPTILEVMVPRRASLDVDAVSANVDVEGTSGRHLAIESVSGDIRLATSSPGEASLQNVSGDIDARLNSSKVEVETVSGDLNVRGALTGEVNAESVSGNVIVASARLHRLEVSTVSGDADLRIGLDADANVSADSVSGTINLVLPANSSARLHAESFSGDIRSPVGHVEEEDHGPGSSLDARMGDGKADVHLESFSGDIRIGSPAAQ